MASLSTTAQTVTRLYTTHDLLALCPTTLRVANNVSESYGLTYKQMLFIVYW